MLPTPFCPPNLSHLLPGDKTSLRDISLRGNSPFPAFCSRRQIQKISENNVLLSSQHIFFEKCVAKGISRREKHRERERDAQSRYFTTTGRSFFPFPLFSHTAKISLLPLEKNKKWKKKLQQKSAKLIRTHFLKKFKLSLREKNMGHCSYIFPETSASIKTTLPLLPFVNKHPEGSCFPYQNPFSSCTSVVIHHTWLLLLLFQSRTITCRLFSKILQQTKFGKTWVISTSIFFFLYLILIRLNCSRRRMRAGPWAARSPCH